MRRSNAIDSNLADDHEGSEWVVDQNRNPRALLDDDDSQAIRIYSEALNATQLKDDALAPVLGIAAQKISDYRNGKRTIAAHRMIRLARMDRAAGILIVRALAKLVGNLEVRERGRIDKNELRKQVEMTYKRNPVVLRAVLADAAQALGIDTEEAAQVWDGETNPGFTVDEIAK